MFIKTRLSGKVALSYYKDEYCSVCNDTTKHHYPDGVCMKCKENAEEQRD